MDPDAPSPDDDAVELPIDGTLDLHHFHPRDVKPLLADTIAECRHRGILELRVIHGKGTGVLRRTVHAALEKNPDVIDFRLAADASAWGATIARLRPVERASML